MTKCCKNAKFTKRENSRLTKNIFSGFLNWILGHLQSSDDENKIAIREISIRAIQKLSHLDQQTFVDGPNYNLTNGKISFVFFILDLNLTIWDNGLRPPLGGGRGSYSSFFLRIRNTGHKSFFCFSFFFFCWNKVNKGIIFGFYR